MQKEEILQNLYTSATAWNGLHTKTTWAVELAMYFQGISIVSDVFNVLILRANFNSTNLNDSCLLVQYTKLSLYVNWHTQSGLRINTNPDLYSIWKSTF
jgi:hypothetical protein